MSRWNYFEEQKVLLVLSVWFLASLLVGCDSQQEGPKLVPVSGKIMVNGKPLPMVGVSFRPDKSKGNTSVYHPGGAADQNGRYELVAAAKPGAPPGWYNVVIFPNTPSPGSSGVPKVTEPFNKKYSNPKTTDLSVEVKEGATPEAYNFQLSK